MTNFRTRLEFYDEMRMIRSHGADAIQAGKPSAAIYALRGHCHDMIAENETFRTHDDPMWVRKALSRLRRASVALYGGVNGRRNLP